MLKHFRSGSFTQLPPEQRKAILAKYSQKRQQTGTPILQEDFSAILQSKDYADKAQKKLKHHYPIENTEGDFELPSNHPQNINKIMNYKEE